MKHIPFMKYKWWYFGLSLVLIIPGLLSLAVNGLRLSIDFTGGTLLEIRSPSPIPAAEFTAVAQSQGLDLVAVLPSDQNAYLLRLKPISQDQNNAFKQALSSRFPGTSEVRFETVGPTIGAELGRKAFLSVFIASVFIIIYIAWSFRHIPKPYASWKFGLSAVVALLHDVLVVVGLFSIFGWLFGVEVDALFVTALLTIIGFSVHDTIVVFDRVRENLPKLPKYSFEQVVDYSLTETIVRSLNTSLTVTLTLTALLLFGGESVRWFVAALLIGIVSGTFSSIFNASPLLVLWSTPKKLLKK